jgi:hypothetical protein
MLLERFPLIDGLRKRAAGGLESSTPFGRCATALEFRPDLRDRGGGRKAQLARLAVGIAVNAGAAGGIFIDRAGDPFACPAAWHNRYPIPNTDQASTTTTVSVSL